MSKSIAERTARFKALRLAKEAGVPRSLLILYKLDTKLNRGKHAGKTIEQILNDDPSYVRNIAESRNAVILDPEVEDRYNEMMR